MAVSPKTSHSFLPSSILKRHLKKLMFAILQHYGIPDKIVSAIRVLCDLVDKSSWHSWTAIRTVFYYHMSVTRWCTSIISIHYRDRLCLQKVCWRFRQSHSQREQSWHSGRAVRSTSRLPDYKVNDLAFADDIAQLENDSIQALW